MSILKATYYEILGVPETATTTTISKAFKAHAPRWHPDKAGQTPENQEKFVAGRNAYELFADPDLRAAYDDVMQEQSRTFKRPRQKMSPTNSPTRDTFQKPTAAPRPIFPNYLRMARKVP